MENDIPGRVAEGTVFPDRKLENWVCVFPCTLITSKVWSARWELAGDRGHIKEGPTCQEVAGRAQHSSSNCLAPPSPAGAEPQKAQTHRGVLHAPGLNCYSHRPLS